MPHEGCTADVQCIHLRAASHEALQGCDPEVEDGAPEAADMLRIHLAEVSEVMVPHKVPRRLAHGCQVQLPSLHNEVFVLPVHRAEPGQHKILSCTAPRCIVETHRMERGT